MSATLYRMIKTCHQDMDQDEHDIFQMFALSFHEHDKEHSLFIDNKNGVYHLKQFPFFSFTLREKNELFYELKNKYFGEKCTYTFQPTAGRNVYYKTLSGGKKTLFSGLLLLFTAGILCFLFRIFDESWEKSSVTGDKVKPVIVNSWNIFQGELEATNSQLVNNEKRITEKLCSGTDITYDEKSDGTNCVWTLLDLTKIQLEKENVYNNDIKFKVLEGTKNFVKSGHPDYAKYIKKYTKEYTNTPQTQTHQKEKGFFESVKQRLMKILQTKDDSNQVALVAQSQNDESVESQAQSQNDESVESQISTAIEEIIKIVKKNYITQTDIANTVESEAQLQGMSFFKQNDQLLKLSQYLDEYLYPKTNGINKHIVKQRQIFQLAVIAPIAACVLNLLNFLPKNFLSEYIHLFGALGGSLHAVTTGYSSSPSIICTFVTWWIAHYTLKYVINSAAISFSPAYKYMKGAYIYQPNNRNQRRLQCVSDEFILHNETSLHTKFLPGEIISLQEDLFIVLAVYGDNKEKRLVLPYNNGYPQIITQQITDIRMIHVNECSSSAQHFVNRLKNIFIKQNENNEIGKFTKQITDVINTHQAIAYEGKNLNLISHNHGNVDDAGTQSIVFKYEDMLYRFDENEKGENKIICIDDSDKEKNNIELMDQRYNRYNYRKDFGLYGNSYTFLTYDVDNKKYKRHFMGDGQWVNNEITLPYDYQYADGRYLWERDTNKFNQQ